MPQQFPEESLVSHSSEVFPKLVVVYLTCSLFVPVSPQGRLDTVESVFESFGGEVKSLAPVVNPMLYIVFEIVSQS